jgi:flagellar biogenesis protein FliO
VSGFEMFLSMLLSIIGIVVVLVLAYYGSKWLSKKYMSVAGGKHVRIIERTPIAQDKSIVIADILGSKYILGISGQQITLLKDLGEIDIPYENHYQGREFSEILKDMLKAPVNQVRNKFKGGK